MVLGEIIEHVSGMSYAAFLHEHVFAPLGMAHAGVYQRQPISSGHALGYLANGLVAPTYLTPDSSSAGAIYSTAGDMYR
ncbi:MAG TPA: serine hydrolase domain-containing protein [Streptosporangiaceae bacterium]|nr:serine hydrolase domain-containing protein [Streptosporangiaceae bacterium]